MIKRMGWCFACEVQSENEDGIVFLGGLEMTISVGLGLCD